VNFGTAGFNITEAVFGSSGAAGVYFGTAASQNGTLAVKTLGKATFTYGDYKGIGKVTIGGVVVESDDPGTGTASVTVHPAGTVTFGGNAITVSGTRAHLKGAVLTSLGKIDIGNDPKAVLWFNDEGDNTELLNGITLTGTGNLSFGGGLVTLAKGELTGLNNSVTTTIPSDLILTVPLQNTFNITNVGVTVAEGGSIVVGGTSGGNVGATGGTFAAIGLLNERTYIRVDGGSQAIGTIGTEKYIVAGTTSSNSIALVGSASSSNAWGSYSSNIIHSAVDFVGTTGLLKGSESVKTNGGTGKILFGTLAE
jgi:hypothetical protein